jgi:hypothetical protein
VLLAVGIEAWLRVSLDGGELDLSLYAPAPFTPGYRLAADSSSLAWIAGRAVRLSTDSDGNRTTVGFDGAAVKTRPTLHIVGDSGVFGWGLADEETIASRVQRLLEGQVEVVNHGVPGWGAYSYVSVIERLPASDWVVVIHSEMNDLWDLYDPDRRALVRCGYVLSVSAVSERTPCFLLDARSLQLLKRRIFLAERGPRYMPLHFQRYSTAAAGVMMHRLHGLYRRSGPARSNRLLFTFVPWEGRYLPDRRALYYPAPPLDTPHVAYPDGCGVLERFERFDDKAGLFLTGDEHLSPLGAEVLAECVVDMIEPRLEAG